MIIGKKYDVTCVKMPKNEHKYLAFSSLNFFERLYSSRQRLYLFNSIFSKNSIEQIFLNVKKYNWLHIIFRKYEIKRVKSILSPVQILKHFHRRKLEKL